MCLLLWHQSAVTPTAQSLVGEHMFLLHLQLAFHNGHPYMHTTKLRHNYLHCGWGKRGETWPHLKVKQSSSVELKWQGHLESWQFFFSALSLDLTSEQSSCKMHELWTRSWNLRAERKKSHPQKHSPIRKRVFLKPFIFPTDCALTAINNTLRWKKKNESGV